MNEAIRDFSQAIELAPDMAGTFNNRGQAHALQKELDLAIDDFSEAIRLLPSFATAYLNRGNGWATKGELDAAIDDFNEAIRLAEQWPLPYLQRGIVYRLQNRFDEAISSFERAIELAPEAAQPYFERGVVLMSQSRFGRAEEDFSLSIQRDDAVASAWQMRAGADSCSTAPWRLGRISNRRCALSPVNADAYFLRAQVRLALSDTDGAIDDFDQVIDMCPTLGAAYHGRGTVWFKRGEHDRATKDFREAVECDPAAAEAIILHRRLIEASDYLEKEPFDRAMDCAKIALEQDPTCCPAHMLIGSAEWYAGNLVEASQVFTTALGLQEERAFGALSCRGQVYAELGEYDLALADLDRAIEIWQQSGEASTAIAYARSGRALAA